MQEDGTQQSANPIEEQAAHGASYVRVSGRRNAGGAGVEPTAGAPSSPGGMLHAWRLKHSARQRARRKQGVLVVLAALAVVFLGAFAGFAGYQVHGPIQIPVGQTQGGMGEQSAPEEPARVAHEPIRVLQDAPVHEATKKARKTIDNGSSTWRSYFTGVYLPVEHISQLPELRTGCEITAATMALDYEGFDASKTDVAEYLPQKQGFAYSDGKRIGPDPDEYFIGSVTTSGWFCNPTPVVKALNAYIKSRKKRKRYEAVDISGAKPSKLYRILDEGYPVVVWVTTSLSERTVASTWYSESDGKEVTSSRQDHAMTLVGHNKTTVILADPLDTTVAYSRELFEKRYKDRGKKAVIVRKLKS